MADAAAGGVHVGSVIPGSPIKPKLTAPTWSIPRVAPVIPASIVIDFSLVVATLGAGLSAIYGFTVIVDAGFIDKESVRTALAMAAPLVTMVAYVSPLPMVIEAVGKSNVQNLPIQVFQLQSMCNILSICYGIQIMNKAVLITNLFGLALQLLFLAGEHYVRTASTQWLRFTIKLSCFLNIVLYVMTTISPLNILGHSITGFNIAMFAAPLAKLPSILQTRNASSLPGAMTVISVVNNAVWALYGLLIQDLVLLLPSVLGYVLSSFQVLLILWCKGILPFDLGFLLLVFADPNGKASVSKDAYDGAANVDGIEMRKVSKGKPDAWGSVKDRVASSLHSV